MKTLKAKFIFWVSLLFILMGILIFVSLSIILPQQLTSQILKRNIKIAQYLSREVQELLLVNNKLTLKLLLEDRLNDLSDGMYIFIRAKDGAIISSTFKQGFPRGLLNINPLSGEDRSTKQDLYKIKEFITEGKKVYDIAIPLLNGELGQLHLGVSLKANKMEIAELNKINYYLAGVLLISLGAGILVFSLLGSSFSRRIIKLKDFAVKLGSGQLNEMIELKTNDEMGILANSFNNMVLNLKEKIETIKRLSYLEERTKLALSLHDGIAQDLADIIKRLELSERLFNSDPLKAKEELKELKNNTKDILNNLRQTIAELKLTKSSGFNLSTHLTEYINNFQKQNNIKVNLEISAQIENIADEKAETIFYIIKEALTNIKKHSSARNALISLLCNDEVLKLNVSDDGRGFEVKEIEKFNSDTAKFGIIGMRERALSVGGDFSIYSETGKGTKISVTIPLKEEKL